MSACSVNEPREVLLGHLAANTLELLAAEFAEVVLRSYRRPSRDDELEAFGARVAERIPDLCRELIGQIRAYENYEHWRRREPPGIDDTPF